MSNLLKENIELMKEYDYGKNQDILLDNITTGSSKKIWWKCSECGNEWQASPKNRTRGGTGCPKCGLKNIGINHNKSILNKRGSLYDNRPDLVEEWDYDKNSPLTPKDVTVGSGKIVWWKCKNGHEWEARVCNRTGGSGCIYCAGQKAKIGENDLTITYPELVKEWDYKKNKDLLPQQFSSGSNKKVWWKCKNGHSWEASINHRTNGTNCPFCSNHGTSFPEQAILFYVSKVTSVESRKKINGQEIDIFLPEYNIGFEYDGIYYHSSKKSKEKEKLKNKIVSNNGITLYHIKESAKEYYDRLNKIIYCKVDRKFNYLEKVLSYIQEIINMKIDDINIDEDRIKIYNQYILCNMNNNFSLYYPELLKEWDYTKNDNLLPKSLSSGSNKKIWWICSKCGSSFETSIEKRIRYSKCPYCSAKKVNETNSLEKRFPDLMKYWDKEKNIGILPSELYYSSRKNVWWICENCGLSYRMPVCSRIKAKTNYCFDCKHKHIGDMNRINSTNNKNNLLIKRPDLVKEWDYEKNFPLTPDVLTIGSGKKVWWKCSCCGNEWQAAVYNRTNGNGCPKCNINGSKRIKN